MEIIRTKSFELAVRTAGDSRSPKLALVMPGRLDTKDYANNISHIQYLSTLGYYAVSFDPPGTWESPGGIELFTTTNYIKAVHELIELYKNKPTLLFGHSRGGTVAMLAGTSNPHVTHIIAAMSYYGAPSAPSHEARELGYQIEMRDMPPGIMVDSPHQKRFQLPIAYFEDGAQYDAAKMIKVSKIPKLYFYGSHDAETDPTDVKKLYEFSAEPKAIHELNSGHSYWQTPGAVDEVNEAIRKFLENTNRQ